MNQHALPRGRRPLLVAELAARGLDSFVRDSVELPRIARRVRLPAFECNIHAPYAWPQFLERRRGELDVSRHANWVRALPEGRLPALGGLADYISETGAAVISGAAQCSEAF